MGAHAAPTQPLGANDASRTAAVTFLHGWCGPPTPHLLLLSPSWALEHSWSQLAHPSLHFLPCKIFQIPFQATWMSSETWRQPWPSAHIFHAAVLLAFRIQPSAMVHLGLQGLGVLYRGGGQGRRGTLSVCSHPVCTPEPSGFAPKAKVAFLFTS